LKSRYRSVTRCLNQSLFGRRFEDFNGRVTKHLLSRGAVGSSSCSCLLHSTNEHDHHNEEQHDQDPCSTSHNDNYDIDITMNFSTRQASISRLAVAGKVSQSVFTRSSIEAGIAITFIDFIFTSKPLKSRRTLAGIVSNQVVT